MQNQAFKWQWFWPILHTFISFTDDMCSVCYSHMHCVWFSQQGDDVSAFSLCSCVLSPISSFGLQSTRPPQRSAAKLKASQLPCAIITAWVTFQGTCSLESFSVSFWNDILPVLWPSELRGRWKVRAKKGSLSEMHPGHRECVTSLGLDQRVR